jgi:tetracycline resistance efflux pump
MSATFWALLPPLLAIAVSLLTKEVNLSLLVGIIAGAGLFCGFNPFTTVTTTFSIMANKVEGNFGVLIFIILLGMIVYLMNLSGATHEYAKWASKRLKTKKQSLIATTFLGIIIFVDDYFNCLTVGTVMRPITDRNKVSREKLAYIIDSTAAPICMVAPISSWAAAVSSSLPDGSKIDGFQLFLRTIPYNFYTWFSLAMIFFTTFLATDFGKMRKYEKACESGDYKYEKMEETKVESNETGKVVDLILPIVFLIGASIVSMLYTGGLFKGGVSIASAFANCDAITGLAMGAAYTVAFLAILYLPRRIVTPKQYLDGLVKGFINMVPASLILTFAWTLSGVCGAEYLNAGGFVAHVVEANHMNLHFMPAVFFVVALLLAFSTGTSWGTFAIMLPITTAVFGDQMTSLTVITTAAVLGGSVCGDHVSPISDTTILSSTGAQCNHLNHVSSQLQYGAVAALMTLVCYLVTGWVNNAFIGLAIGIIVLFAFVMLVKKHYGD